GRRERPRRASATTPSPRAPAPATRSPDRDLDAPVPGLVHVVPGGDEKVVLAVGVEVDEAPVDAHRHEEVRDPAGATEAEPIVVLPGPHGVGVADDADVTRAALPDALDHVGQARLGLRGQLVRIALEVEDEAGGLP